MSTCRGCGGDATEVVVTLTGWVLDVCHGCAIRACDPLSDAALAGWAS